MQELATPPSYHQGRRARRKEHPVSELLYASCIHCGADLGVLLSGPASLVCDACLPTAVSGVVSGPAATTIDLEREAVGHLA
jgi:hypothetical protein